MRNSQQLLNATELAQRLGVKSRWLVAEVEAGNLPAARVGDGLIFDAVAVERVLRKRAKCSPGKLGSGDDGGKS